MLSFSADSIQLAAATRHSYFDYTSALTESDVVCACQIKVWRVDGSMKQLSINIPHPLGEWVELWPPVEKSEVKKSLETAFNCVVPTRLQFNSDGKRLTSETATGLRTVYDTQTGRILQNSGVASVGFFKSMLMIGLHEVPARTTTFTMSLTAPEVSVDVKRRADGWWQLGKDREHEFRIDAGKFVSRKDRFEKTEHVFNKLGLKEDTTLTTLDSFDHPLGVIKLTHRTTSLQFRLTRRTDKSDEIIQSGEVRWATSFENR